MSDIEERLRASAYPLSIRQMETNEDGIPTIPGDPEGLTAAETMTEAADHIAQLEAECERYLQEISDQEAEIMRLREALKPFAEAAQDTASPKDEWWDKALQSNHREMKGVYVSDLRRAREALKEAS